MKNYQNNLFLIVLNKLAIFFILLFLILSEVLSVSKRVGFVDTQKIIDLFPEIKSKLQKVDIAIQQKKNKIYNLPRSLEVKFISEMENYYNQLIKQRNILERELQQSIMQQRNVDDSIKNQIKNLQKNTEALIKAKKQQITQKMYEIENQIYDTLTKELEALRKKYESITEMKIQEEIYKSRKQVEDYRQEVREIYKNQIINLNLKISNSSIYDQERKQALETLQKIKNTQEELVKQKIEQVEKQLYQNIQKITQEMEKEYKQKSKEIIKRYEQDYRHKQKQMISQYEEYIKKMENEYNKQVMEILKNLDLQVIKELYEQYNTKIREMQIRFENYRKNLAEKYDRILIDTILTITLEIEQLEQQKQKINYEIRDNIFNIVQEVAREKNLEYVFANPISTYNCVDITQECVQRIREKLKTK
ncbi:MAG: hypothetical protein ABDH21_06100 [bacterium]